MVRHLSREKDMSTLRALIEKCSQFAFSLSSAATVISAFRNKRLPSNLVCTLLHGSGAFGLTVRLVVYWALWTMATWATLGSAQGGDGASSRTGKCPCAGTPGQSRSWTTSQRALGEVGSRCWRGRGDGVGPDCFYSDGCWFQLYDGLHRHKAAGKSWRIGSSSRKRTYKLHSRTFARCFWWRKRRRTMFETLLWLLLSRVSASSSTTCLLSWRRVGRWTKCRELEKVRAWLHGVPPGAMGAEIQESLTGMLLGILNGRFKGDAQNDIESWERDIRSFEKQTSFEILDFVKAGISRLDTYERFKGKGKGKSKDHKEKGKPNQRKGAHGKSSDTKEMECYYCGKKGHKKSDAYDVSQTLRRRNLKVDLHYLSTRFMKLVTLLPLRLWTMHDSSRDGSISQCCISG